MTDRLTGVEEFNKAYERVIGSPLPEDTQGLAKMLGRVWVDLRERLRGTDGQLDGTRFEVDRVRIELECRTCGSVSRVSGPQEPNAPDLQCRECRRILVKTDDTVDRLLSAFEAMQRVVRTQDETGDDTWPLVRLVERRGSAEVK